MRKILMLIFIMIAGIAVASSYVYAALTPNATYTITIQKVNSNGSVSNYSATTATADSTGKLEFSLSNMPTDAEANFFVFIITDTSGTVVRKGFAPAPHAGATNLVGVNSLSTSQTNAILAAGQAAGTDDPIAVAFLLVLLRSPNATESDATLLAQIGVEAITGSTGFEGTLTSNGITAAQLATFKSKLIYNGTAGKKTIADMTASFKTAVDSGNDTTATQEMQKAGGFMADVFIDAAEAAGIDLGLIIAAHDAAGAVAGSSANITRMGQITATVQSSINQAMSSFFMRIASVKVKSEYTKALNTLNASGTQVDSFNSAVNVMLAANANVEATYGEYFMNPDTYVSSHGTTHSAVQTAIGQMFQTAFTAFQTNITSPDGDITTMKSNVASAFGIAVGQLPSDFGKYYNFSGNQINWPIPQVVMVNWLATIISAGGSLSYTRDATAVPSTMTWLGNCSNTTYFDQVSCVSNGATWTSGVRHTFSTPSTAFNAYLGIQEDLQIIEFSRYSIYQSGTPTREQESQAKLTFQTRIEGIAGNISGTTNGSTAISADQKKAIVKLLMQPSMD
ncbi:MAG: hypothetical protein HY755_09830 [Nitrospirae bacterium]|nr:hypothetical protein [Nitrospirota bacterium]